MMTTCGLRSMSIRCLQVPPRCKRAKIGPPAAVPPSVRGLDQELLDLAIAGLVDAEIERLVRILCLITPERHAGAPGARCQLEAAHRSERMQQRRELVDRRVGEIRTGIGGQHAAIEAML